MDHPVDRFWLFGPRYPCGQISLKKEDTCPESEPDEHPEEGGGAAEAGARQRRQRRAHAVTRRVTPDATGQEMDIRAHEVVELHRVRVT